MLPLKIHPASYTQPAHLIETLRTGQELQQLLRQQFLQLKKLSPQHLLV